MGNNLKRVIVLFLVIALAGGVVATTGIGESKADELMEMSVGAGVTTPGAFGYTPTSTTISINNPDGDYIYAIYDGYKETSKRISEWKTGDRTDSTKSLVFSNIGLKPNTEYYIWHMPTQTYSVIVNAQGSLYKGYFYNWEKNNSIVGIRTAIDPFVTSPENKYLASTPTPGHTSITIKNADKSYSYTAYTDAKGEIKASGQIPTPNTVNKTFVISGLEAGKTYYIKASSGDNSYSDIKPVTTMNHAFTYTAVDKYKIIATCSAAECKDIVSYYIQVINGTETATKAYDGSTVPVLTLFDANNLEFYKAIKYTLKGGGDTTTENSGTGYAGGAPIYPGEYVATVTLGGNTITKNIKITGNGPTADAPTGLEGVAPTTATAKDGKIKGLKATEIYYYSVDNGENWQYATGVTEISGLSSGIVLVRTYNPTTGYSKIAAVAIGAAPDASGNTPNPNPNAATPGTGSSLPVSGNSSQNIPATVKNGNATISSITGNDYSNMFKIDPGKDTQEIIIDASATALGVSNITLSKAVMNDLAKGLADKSNNKDFLVMKTKDASISMDVTALNNIISQAKGTDVTFRATTIEQNKLSTSQASAVKALNDAATTTVQEVFKLEVVSNNTAISDFGKGNITVEKFGYRATTGKDQRKFHVYYLPTTGGSERLSTWIFNNSVCFNTSHFSEYAVVYDTNRDNDELVPVYRYYNPGNGDHLFTIDTYEVNVVKRAGWVDEGIPFYAFKSAAGSPIYRLYNPNTGEHFYTMDSSERSLLIRHGWSYEEYSFVSNGRQNVYRLYNPNQISNNHHFTTSLAEYETLKKAGWRDEFIVFNVQ